MPISDPFPLLSRPLGEGCTYLRRNAIHRELHEGLKRSILVVAQGNNQNGGGVPGNVQHYLYNTYGGAYMQYAPLKYSKDIFLFQLPAGLDHEEVIDAGNEWGSSQEWSFRYFDIDADAGMQSKPYRVRLHITNFPLDFWHESFMQEACAGFGEVRHIDEEFIRRNDRSTLALDIICIDPRRIPPTSILPFGNKWKKIYIYIAGWEYNEWTPEEAKLTRNEYRSLVSLTAGTADLYQTTLIAAHDKLQRFLNSAQQLTPPASPSYFSDDAVDMLDQATENPGPPSLLNSEEIIPKSQTWRALFLPSENLSFQIGAIPVVCEDVLISTCLIGSHAVHICTQTEGSAELGKEKIDVPSRVGSVPEGVNAGVQSMGGLAPGEAHEGATEGLLGIKRQKNQQAQWFSETKQAPIPHTSYKGELSNLGSCKSTVDICTAPQLSSVAPCQKPFFSTNDTVFHAFGTSLQMSTSLPDTSAKGLNGPLQFSHQPFSHSPVFNLDWTSKSHHHYTSPTFPLTQKITQHQFVSTEVKQQMTDEEFILQFANLSAGSCSSSPVEIPAETVTERDWSVCALVRVVTDKPVIETYFSTLMKRVWGVHTTTEIRAVTHNIFFANFNTMAELERIMHKGVWNYRGDAVILKRLTGPAELANPIVGDMEVWTQLHKIPFQAISHEGVLLVAKRIGIPRSGVSEIFQGGNTFHKIKLQIPIDQPLKDVVPMNHPTLGIYRVYPSYERLNRICLYCSKVGHDIQNCPDQVRMERLRRDPRFCDKPEMQNITKPKVGQWIMNPDLIPDDNSPQPLFENHPSHTNLLPPVITQPSLAANEAPDPLPFTPLTENQRQPIFGPDQEMSSVYPNSGTGRTTRALNQNRSQHQFCPYQRQSSPAQPRGADLNFLHIEEGSFEEQSRVGLKRNTSQRGSIHVSHSSTATSELVNSFSMDRAAKKQTVEVSKVDPPLDI